jgi:hypothetical protein
MLSGRVDEIEFLGGTRHRRHGKSRNSQGSERSKRGE